MPRLSNQLVMNTGQKVNLSQKRWLSAGATTVVMASVLMMVQVSTKEARSIDAPVLINKISYVGSPEFEHKKLTSEDVNPELTQFLGELVDPTQKEEGSQQNSGSGDIYYSMKSVQDLQMRIRGKQADPHYDPTENKRRLMKIRNQIQQANGGQVLEIDRLFDLSTPSSK